MGGSGTSLLLLLQSIVICSYKVKRVFACLVTSCIGLYLYIRVS